jgi:hypothetical protein
MAGGGWLVDILIVVIAVLGAPHLRTLLEWLLAGGLIHLWQQLFLPPAPIRVRSIPNPRDALRQQSLYTARVQSHIPGMGRQAMDGIDHMPPWLEESLRLAEKRIEFLEMLEWSFPLEDVQISRGPVTINWNMYLDDFWADNVDPRRIVDSSVPQHHFVDEMTSEVYQAAQIQFQQTRQTIESLHWQKIDVRMGICYQQMGEGTVCAVHRWDARDVESLDLVGRVQCWSDPSLLQWKPEFVVEHPEFNPQSNHGPDGEGTVCIAEVRDSVVVVGCPMSHAMIYGNSFEFQHSHGENEWEANISNTTTPAEVFAQMTQFAVHGMCDFGGCDPIVPNEPVQQSR